MKLSQKSSYCRSVLKSYYNSKVMISTLLLFYTIPLGYTYNNSCFSELINSRNFISVVSCLIKRFIGWVSSLGSLESIFQKLFPIFTFSPIYVKKTLGDFCANGHFWGQKLIQKNFFFSDLDKFWIFANFWMFFLFKSLRYQFI